MRAARVALCGMAVIMLAMPVMPTGILAQEAGDVDQSYRFNREELAQMLAPIALYPDALTAQILMASTYPLEVVEADRWRSRNSGLSESELDSALQDKPWDPSIKALCHFPQILSSMSEKLDQTLKLGDAFLGQEQEVMATIQELRRKAQELGHLNNTAEQKVIVDPDAIRIEPVNPDVVYVPVYDPAYVYGPWWYPDYPPYYWYYPPGFYSGAYVSFSPGIYLGFDLFSWVRFDWRVHRIHVDIDRTGRFNRQRFDRRDDGGFWRHNPRHRRGVAYRDMRTSERYGSRPTRIEPYNRERRGYPQQQIDRQQRTPQVGSPRGDRATPPALRQEPTRQRPSEIRPERIETPRFRTEGLRPQQPVIRESSPFRGIGAGSFERKAAERGGISIRSGQFQQRQDFGGSRGDGGQQRREDRGSRGGRR
ncbi:MAG: DUF3300 domain-containing protein [Geobacteraceae bacterium]|nr:DUF3300 domain-containing protein [Geobacteraceae bacterium]